MAGEMEDMMKVEVFKDPTPVKEESSEPSDDLKDSFFDDDPYIKHRT
jgi:hypothetical protein